MRLSMRKYKNRMFRVILTKHCFLVEAGRRNFTLWF
jgi:hypothetical protein